MGIIIHYTVLVLRTMENRFDWSYPLRAALSVPFILFTKSKLRSQPEDTKPAKKRGKSEEEDSKPSLLRVFVGADELGSKDTERVSCRAAVCSEWASCSLLILVSQNPLSSQALPKRRTGTASLHCTQRQSLLLRGGPIQRWPTGSRITGETICCNQGRASATSSVFFPRDTVHLHSTPRLDRPDPARLAFGQPREPLGRCWWAWCPSLDALRAACWQWHVGLLTEHRGGAEEHGEAM